MALRIFSRWIELHRGSSEHEFLELQALLTQNQIRFKATTKTLNPRMAAYAGAGGCSPTNTGATRIGYVNPALSKAFQEANKEAPDPVLYRIRIRACDWAPVRKLQSAAQ